VYVNSNFTHVDLDNNVVVFQEQIMGNAFLIQQPSRECNSIIDFFFRSHREISSVPKK
jgi:hypothetical protein